jgi:hypothetical protein
VSNLDGIVCIAAYDRSIAVAFRQQTGGSPLAIVAPQFCELNLLRREVVNVGQFVSDGLNFLGVSLGAIRCRAVVRCTHLSVVLHPAPEGR